MALDIKPKEKQIKDRSVRQKKIISLGAILTFIVLSIVILGLVGKPMIAFVSELPQYRGWVDDNGFISRLVFVGMMILQIVVAFIPGEPLEIAAGYAFGFWEGSLLCLIGAVIGSAIVFLFVRHIGMRAVEVFVSREKIQSLKFLKNTRKLNSIVFLLFLIPGTPKDIMTYFIGMTKMKFSTWLLITGIARIPSVITSTMCGDALGIENYTIAIWVFGLTAIISLMGLLFYKKISGIDGEKNEG
ncbi:TVP38/TMEM64 family protein [Acetobacterium paludosum]|uniref:TVP38/TMEM64 family membrane protein n=1 Tax=Acetobacterium paludosum TaxID=52693 RepID=A0A923KX47_9FIRM|nr:TVP38/TMEM64 family protein [Acetobacterium paludosum]MBC3888858.1 TVP38/TMEM64 family protein [Acetobacterium paludosum]